MRSKLTSWTTSSVSMLKIIPPADASRLTPPSKVFSPCRVEQNLISMKLHNILWIDNFLLIATTPTIMFKKKKIFSSLTAFAFIGLSTCTTIPQTASSGNSLTHGQVQMNIRVGQTTQSNILEAFGAPNITTIDGQGREVWTYQRHATVSRSSSGYATAILLGTSSSGFESSMRTMTLIIKFDRNKKVSDFKSMSSNF